MQLLSFIFQVVRKMAEQPVRKFIRKFFKPGECVACGSFNCVYSPGAQQALIAVGLHAVVMVVQKTTNVELAGPIQHLQFYLWETCKAKRCGYAVQQMVLEIVVLIVNGIIEQVHVLELIILKGKIVFVL